jgi:hypothetical protein
MDKIASPSIRPLLGIIELPATPLHEANLVSDIGWGSHVARFAEIKYSNGLPNAKERIRGRHLASHPAEYSAFAPGARRDQ